MLGNLTGWHLIIVVVVILLLFGATKLPALARGVGQSLRIFKQEIRSLDDTEDEDGKASKNQSGSKEPSTVRHADTR